MLVLDDLNDVTGFGSRPPPGGITIAMMRNGVRGIVMGIWAPPRGWLGC